MIQLKEFSVNPADGDSVVRAIGDVNSWLSEAKVLPLQFFVLGNSLVVVYPVIENADAKRGDDSLYVERRTDSVSVAPSVVAKESGGADKKRARTNVLVPARSAQKNTSVLCQAGVFGFPPGASMVPGDPPVPSPLIATSSFDLKEWSEFFTESR